MPNSVNLSSESWEAVREERTEPLVYLTSLFGAESICLSVQGKVNSRLFDGLRCLLQTLVVIKTSSLMALGSKEFETDASLLPDHRCLRPRTNDLPNDILFVNTQYNVCSSSYRTGVGASRTRQGLVCSRERASPWTRRKASKAFYVHGNVEPGLRTDFGHTVSIFDFVLRRTWIEGKTKMAACYTWKVEWVYLSIFIWRKICGIEFERLDSFWTERGNLGSSAILIIYSIKSFKKKFDGMKIVMCALL